MAGTDKTPLKTAAAGHNLDTLAAAVHSPPGMAYVYSWIFTQPLTAPVHEDLLRAEIKGIYAALLPVESKCIEVDNIQSSQSDPADKSSNVQWQALAILHKLLLDQHHEFFLALQRPAANPAMRRIAAKYAMAARMWRHGIHPFLEILRRRLPESREHMLTYLYMSYSMVVLLYETVSTFEDAWVENLGDLARYRMAIEDDEIRDREIWTVISRNWYSQALDMAPAQGRLYHHLAILSRPNVLQQLYYYSKSLCVEMPFLSARESIMTLFEPLISHTSNPQQADLAAIGLEFGKTYGILFSGKQLEELEATMETFFRLLDNYIGRSTRGWLEAGYHMGISNICSVTGYGDESNPIAAALKAFSRANPKRTTESQDQPMQDATASETPSPNTTPVKQLPNALRLLTGTYHIVCRRFGDPNVLPFLHVTLVFVHHLTFCPDAMAYVAPHFPWKLTAFMLNTLLKGSAVLQALAPLLESEQFCSAGLG